jgi:hypothetical protein
MWERFNRSWELVKVSADILRKDKELLLFPLFSAVGVFMVMAAFVLPVFGIYGLDGIRAMGDGHRPASPGMYLVAFLYYGFNYFVIFFFNAALVGAVMIRLQGGDPTFKDGIDIAKSKLGVILVYAFIAATVGIILRIIQERVGFIGKIVVALIGASWTIATFMVVPVLVDRDVGPFEAIKESAALLRETWGENVIGQAGIGLAFGIIMMGVMVFSVFLIIVAAMSHSMVIIGMAVILVVLALSFTALVQAALAGIYSAALYQYAAHGKAPELFDESVLKGAFAAK